MARNRRAFSMDHPVVITFLMLAIIGFMFAAGEVLKPLALAILLSFALAPIARFLENRGLPRVPAVALTVVLALTAIGFMTYEVGSELNILADNVDKYQDNMEAKIRKLKPSQANAITKVQTVFSDVSKTLAPTTEKDVEKVQKVQLAQESDYLGDTEKLLGPYLEGMGTAFIVMILLLYLMINRENMSDRLTQLFGHGRISLTTRTINEVGERISKYLVSFAAMNSAMGVVVAIGCYFIGIEYAVLWGFLAGALRFIPYAGSATAFALPLLFSVAAYNGWTKPIELVALYTVLEVTANIFLEPFIYGKTTGVSALALLVAALFWTWLWGPIGLLLSTPLTVSLAVLGKYVPSLHFFATFLHEDIELDSSVRFYQRMLAADQDGATEVIDQLLKEKPRAELFDEVVIPSLSLAERDHARDEIGDQEVAFMRRTTESILDDLADEPEINLATLSTASNAASTSPAGPTPPPGSPIRILALPAHDDTDALVLQMLALLLKPTGINYSIGQFDSPLEAVERVNSDQPDLVVISHLPPDGLTATRYLIRRIRARFPKIPIVVGRWDHDSTGENVKKTLAEAGATKTFSTLKETRDYLVTQANSPAASKAKVPTHA